MDGLHCTDLYCLKELRHGLCILKNLAYIFQVRVNLLHP